MPESKTLRMGQRVQYLSGGKWQPTGAIVNIQPELTMTIGRNTAKLSSTMYMVQWDDSKEISGWLSYHELKAL